MLLLWGPFPVLFSQEDNQAAYQKLIIEFAEQLQAPIQSWEGSWPDDWRPDFRQDSAAQMTIMQGETEVSYERISKDTFQREIVVPLSIQDSTFRSEMLVFSDTLSLRTIREIRKRSAAPFRGDAPGRLATILRPVLFITVSVAALISLFYIRSR